MQISSEELLTQIRNQITAYQMNVRSDNKAHRYNINDRAEAFTIPLFKLIFGLDELRDLNIDQANFPGIDLGDFENRVAVQVTSETTLKKVKDTLETFVNKKYYKQFDRLIIFMIEEKQKSYSKDAIARIYENKFDFDPKRDIIGLNDLLKFIKGHQRPRLQRFLKLFQEETGYLESTPKVVVVDDYSDQFSAPNDPPYEDGFLNLIEIGFPDTLFIADWNFTKKQLGTSIRNDRKLVLKALDQQDLKFAVDWVTYERQIITFHNLGDDLLPLSSVVDKGTITSLGTDEFFENPAYRNKFVELLQRCLQQKLYHLGIHWQYYEKEYIFVPQNNERVREIRWTDVRPGTRTVYKQIPDLKDNTKAYCHEHFAFKTKFCEFDSVWYLAVKPDWFYSTDGYQRHRFAIEDKRSYKKRVEANRNVSTHIRFIQSFISTNDPGNTNQMSLFAHSTGHPRIYEFLWIKGRLDVNGLPRLPDSEWRRKNPTDFERMEPLFS